MFLETIKTTTVAEKSGRVLANMHRLWICSLAPQNKQANNKCMAFQRLTFLLVKIHSLEVRANKYPDKRPDDNLLQNNYIRRANFICRATQ